jgi:glutathione S-transferase
LKFLNDVELVNKKFMVGDSFTIVDSYLYIVLTWLGPTGLDAYPVVKAYFDGISSLEGVVAAHAKMATSPTSTV